MEQDRWNIPPLVDRFKTQLKRALTLAEEGKKGCEKDGCIEDAIAWGQDICDIYDILNR